MELCAYICWTILTDSKIRTSDEDKFFYESHSLWSEVVLVTAKWAMNIGQSFDLTKLVKCMDANLLLHGFDWLKIYYVQMLKSNEYKNTRIISHFFA